MSWFEAKIHKGAVAHSLQNLHYADIDFAATGGAVSPGSSDGFQMVRFDQPTAFSAQTNQYGEDQRLSRRVSGLEDAAGINQQDQKVNELLAALAKSLAELSRLREKVLKNSADDMLRLALTIAEQVIHREIKADPTIILANLQEALQAAISSDVYHVRIHPDDMAVVMEKKPLFLASISGLKNITLEADAAVTRGGCLIESELGEVDASIEGQLNELRHKLLPCEGK